MTKQLHYSETPVIEIADPVIAGRGVRLLIKREDLNHPLVSGNKWWKLKYNLLETFRINASALLTFGGPWSNHIHAVAAATKELGINSVGIIRGERPPVLSPTLQFAGQQGMKLHFVSRSDYRKKNDRAFLNNLHEIFGNCFLVPEGGTNSLGVAGASEFVSKITSVNFDVVCVPVGTGGTIAGLIAGLKGDRQILGIPVLKHPGLDEEIRHHLETASAGAFSNWNLLHHYHHGGYAKTTDELINFMRMMQNNYHLPLDQVYTGKMLFAIYQEILDGHFPRGTTILAIHTGGQQGAVTI